MFQALDLQPYGSQFARVNLCGSIFLGCQMELRLSEQCLTQGATVIPNMPSLPFKPFRSSLYEISSIYSNYEPKTPNSWEKTFDAVAYSWFMDPVTQQPRKLGVVKSLFARAHDTCLEFATARFLTSKNVVGFMGGHDIVRNKPEFKTIAILARRLSREGLFIITGGGPGLMEAANLGAFLAPFADVELDRALETLGNVLFTERDRWLATAAEVRSRLLGKWDAKEPEASSNLGVPTWLYGHEPPNMFSTHVAKLFYNSLREDGLVTLAGNGIVFGRGSAGTVQEIFQDTTQNYYRKKAIAPTPMVLLGEEFWNGPAVFGKADPEKRKPLYPLLRSLALEKTFLDAVLLTDDPEEIISLLKKAPAAEPRLADLWLNARSL
jgi:predicted Rossmann-fold nucleotide-binding protein